MWLLPSNRVITSKRLWVYMWQHVLASTLKMETGVSSETLVPVITHQRKHTATCDLHSSQNYWQFGFYPLFGILKTRKHTVQWLRLVLSKGPNRAGVFSLTWGWKQVQFLKHCFLWFLEHSMTDQAHKPRNSKCHTPPSEPFRLHLHSSMCFTVHVLTHECFSFSMKLLLSNFWRHWFITQNVVKLWVKVPLNCLTIVP
jgi:hypothetical protein